MALFEFDLVPVQDINPWGDPGDQSLGWYALTLGFFHMPVGDQVLCRYTPEIVSHWGSPSYSHAYYEIGAFARDILGSVASGVAALPETFEALVRNCDLLDRLRKQGKDDRDQYYTAWRWVGERSPWISYLTFSPQFEFFRVGDDVFVHWDNRHHSDDGIPVWTAQHGVHVLPVDAFLRECHDFADRLFAAMSERIDAIEAGTARPRIPLDVQSLRREHERWVAEYRSCLDFSGYAPDIPWSETEAALREIAEKSGIRL